MIGGIDAAPLVGPIAVLVGVALVLLAQVAFVGRILLEARGDIAFPAAKAAAKSAEAAPASAEREVAAPRLAVASEEGATESPEAEREESVRIAARKSRRERRFVEPEDSKWVSGVETESEADYGDDDEPRRMSKADRKRLRRQRERDAA
jgi:hypothetical protein